MVSDEFGPAGRSGGHQGHREIARADIAVAGHVDPFEGGAQERPSTKCPAEVSNALLPQRRMGDHDRDASGFARGKGRDNLRGIGRVRHDGREPAGSDVVAERIDQPTQLGSCDQPSFRQKKRQFRCGAHIRREDAHRV